MRYDEAGRAHVQKIRRELRESPNDGSKERSIFALGSLANLVNIPDARGKHRDLTILSLSSRASTKCRPYLRHFIRSFQTICSIRIQMGVASKLALSKDVRTEST